jgi:hypothetical protein
MAPAVSAAQILRRDLFRYNDWIICTGRPARSTQLPPLASHLRAKTLDLIGSFVTASFSHV